MMSRGRLIILSPAAMIAVIALAAGGCGGSSASHVAQLGSTTTSTQNSRSSTGSGGPSTSGAAPTSQTLAYARCMRSHGVPSFPDPSSSGQIPKPQVVDARKNNPARFDSANTACQHLLPNGGGNGDRQAWVQQVMTALSKFARCVRSHGVQNWPDPLAESDPGQPDTPGFPRTMPDVNQDSPRVKAALSSCQHLLASIGYASGGYP